MPPDTTPLIGPDEIRPRAKSTVSTQIADAIRSRILAGEMQTGDRLPGERTLAEQLGHNRQTVKAAYQQLAASGYLIIRHGAPPTVRRPPPPRLMTNERYRTVVNALKAGNFDPASAGFCVDYGVTWDEYTVEAESAIEPANEPAAGRLHMQTGAPVLVRPMVEFARDVPVQIRRSVMPAHLAGKTPIAEPFRQPWPGGTVGELMSLGLETTRVVEDIVSRPATLDEAAALQLPDGLTVWEITRMFYVTPLDQLDANPWVAEASELILPSPGNTLRLVTHV